MCHVMLELFRNPTPINHLTQNFLFKGTLLELIQHSVLNILIGGALILMER